MRNYLTLLLVLLGACNIQFPPGTGPRKTKTPTPVQANTPTQTSTPTITQTHKPTNTSTPTPTFTPVPMSTQKPFQATEGKIEFFVSGLETIPEDDDDAVIVTSAWEQDLTKPNRDVPVIGIHARNHKFTFRFSNKISYDQWIYPRDNNAEQCGTGIHPSVAQESKNGLWSISWRNNFQFNGDMYSEIIVRSPMAQGSETLNWRPQIQTPKRYGEFFAATTGTLGLRWKVSAKGTFGLGSFYKGAQWKPQDKRYHADNRPIWNWDGIKAVFSSMVGTNGTLTPCPKMVN